MRHRTSRFVCLAGVVALCISGNARADGILIDDFGCADSLNTAGPIFVTSGPISCSSAIGGIRGDSIFFTGGTGSAASSIASNPPAGAITGTIGPNPDGAVVMTWTGSTTGGVANLPNLDLVGDYILIQSESDLGGAFNLNIFSGLSTSNNPNYLTFSAAMPANGFDSGFADVLIPLVGGTGPGADLSNVTAISLAVSLPVGGGFELDDVSAVPSPEPGSAALALSAGMLLLFGKPRRR